MDSRNHDEATSTTERRNERSASGARTMFALFLGVAAVVAVFLLVAFTLDLFDDDPDVDDLSPANVIDDDRDDEDLNQVGFAMSALDVQQNPEEYVGERVTISGEVDEIITPRSFTIGGEDFLGSILIVSSEELRLPAGAEREEIVSHDDIVQVTGVVYILEEGLMDEAGDGYQFLFEDDTYAPYMGDTVILVDSVDLTPRYEVD